MANRPTNLDAAVLNDMLERLLYRVVDEWGITRPRVLVAYKYERMCYAVRFIWNMKWCVDWETDTETPDDLIPELFDDWIETWAQDANIPLTGELEVDA